jgi:uncharacterized protein YggT (Ycf19 family)
MTSGSTIALVVLTFIDLFVSIFNLILLVRVVASYIAQPGGRFYSSIVNITEPVLIPVRRMLPAMPGVDLAPLVTFFLLEGLQYMVHWWFNA